MVRAGRKRHGFAILGALTVACGGTATREPAEGATGVRWSTARATTAEPSAAASEAPAEGGVPSDPRVVAPTPAALAKEIDGATRTPHVAGPLRPKDADGVPIDFSSIPETSDRPVAVGDLAGAFSIIRIDRTPKVCPLGLTPRELILWYVPSFWARPVTARIGNRALPPLGGMNGRYADPSLDPLLRTTQDATWTGIEKHETTANVVRYEGVYDAPTRRARAVAMQSVDAVALVDNVLYAYRRCAAHCDERLGAKSREERIVLIGPPASLLGTSDDPLAQASANGLPFSEVSARIVRGSSASLMIMANRDDVASFGGSAVKQSSASATADWTTYTLDIVWPASTDDPSNGPEVMLYTGSLRSAPAAVGGTSIHPFSGFEVASDTAGCQPIPIDFADPSF